jgi:hypothetical protein
MMQLAGTYVTILYDRSKKAKHPMIAIPEDGRRSVLFEPVFTCVYNQKTQTLIVDDLIAMNGTVIHQQTPSTGSCGPRYDTQSVSSGYASTASQGGVRKYFAYSQLGECLDLVKMLDYPSIGVSIKPSE